MKEINSLEQLQKEKQKLQLKIEVSKREFANSLNSTQSDAKRFFLNKVVIPVSIAGVAGVGFTKLRNANKKKKQEEVMASNYAAAAAASRKYQQPEETTFDRWKDLVIKLLPIAIQMFQSYFISKQIEEEEEED